MKKLTILTFAVAFALTFVSCAQKGTCDACKKENVTIYKVTDTVFGTGETANLCKDCKKKYEDTVKAFKAMGDLLKNSEELDDALDSLNFDYLDDF